MPTLRSPEALLFVPLALGYVGIAICIGVMAVARWLGREEVHGLPAARVRRLPSVDESSD